MRKLKTSHKLRAFEALIETISKLLAIYFVYLAFNWLVGTLLGKNLAEDTLLSLLLLPALYVLRDANHIADPLTVRVTLFPDKISVIRGISPRVNDTLEYQNVENIEVITPILGWLCGYATVRLYSPGGYVEIPYVYRAEKIVSIVERLKKKHI
ncbi:PH domain-containing protein [Aliivibrio finisterrensis]|uniref:PH domain-containing protein n=1 Tax=Aliivibrio finisterrensis TaxID=511998 RepID=A0A6N6RNV4_9GAMM|nr:PH domain-containing protein [Aliivibrio finisterrensis]KAB2823133.1 PH domain-containing protein [Aliivibrio finisterrensis]